MSRLARPLHPLALSVAIAFAAVPLLAAQPVFAEDSDSAVRRFEVAAGDLSQALNSLAEQAGLVLAFDASLTRGKRSNGLNGQYGTDTALAQLLAGSGLQALKIAADRYRLEAVPDSGGAMELQATTISAAYQTESPTGPVVGYVASRSLSGTKTDTALIETPQSISVVTKDQMRAQNAESLNQILRYSAAVVPETRGATASRLDQLTIRGFAPATYLDGLRVPSSRDALPQKDAFDLERVEVLRGPASVLYGQGTPSGVINMVTKRPLDTPFHEVGVEYGTFNKKRTTFDLSGPIDDQGVYAYRVAGLFDDADGQVEHTETRRQSLSSAFTWRPDDATSLTLLGHFQKDPKGASYGSVPAWGSVLHSPTGRKMMWTSTMARRISRRVTASTTPSAMRSNITSTMSGPCARTPVTCVPKVSTAVSTTATCRPITARPRARPSPPMWTWTPTPSITSCRPDSTPGRFSTRC